MNVPIKLNKMSQTFAENKIDAEENKIQCCICYDDNSEEGSNKGKLIECCSNKHILCIECFHKSYERKCECPLCRELMFRPEIMSDDESLAYYSAKRALKQKKEREEQQRQFRIAEAERQRQEVERRRLEVERRRQEELARLPIRKTERIQIIQRRKDEIIRQFAMYNAEIENINNLGLDEYNALYPPNFEPRTTPLNIINNISDSDTDDNVDIVYGPAPRPVQIHPVAARPVVPVQQPVARPVPVQQPVARVVPVQQPRPVQQLVARPVQQPVARPVQQPVTRPVQQPVTRPLTTQEQIHQLINQSLPRPRQQEPRQQEPRQRRSSNYAREKLAQGEILVQTLRGGHRMVVRYDRLNDVFIRVSDNTVYRTLNRASAVHASEVGLASIPNPWTTFNRQDGSSIDNL
jgi:hypothetical protein